MTRSVLCPKCNAVNDYPFPATTNIEHTDRGVAFSIQNADCEPIVCFFCGEQLKLDSHDFQNVEFVESNDGYHSWYSQPTSIHTIWRCKTHPLLCRACSHNAASDIFCNRGRIDIRTAL